MVRAEPLPQAVFLMGPTAAGKTDLAVELVRRWPFAIISVDSAMVYREMDIGTAKPDAATLALAPHRLIDILDPSEAYSAACFRQDALREMEAITQAGRIPLLVGGTMFYFRALQYGLTELPAGDENLRQQLDQAHKTQGSVALHTRLAQIDPQTAQRIHPNDPQRIKRALEVYQLTGKSLTELYAHQSNQALGFSLLKLTVAPAERQILHQRIEQRFQHMLQQGLVAEVEKLYQRSDLSLAKPALRAVGYRQVWEYLDGLLTYDVMIQRGISATRQFAKRQLTWLRADSDVKWLDSKQANLLDQAVKMLKQHGFLPQ